MAVVWIQGLKAAIDVTGWTITTSGGEPTCFGICSCLLPQ